MKTIFILLFCCTFLPLAAQDGMTKIEPGGEFNRRLTEEAGRVQSIACDFVQVKYLDVFDEKVTSRGRFYFRKENKICLEYTTPVDYLIVINDTKLKIVSEGKTSVVNLGSNPLMNQMKGMLAACMVGNLSGLSSGYEVEYFENTALYKVVVRPVSPSVQAYLRSITIWLDKKDMSVKTLRLAETEKDYTEYEFTNKQYNTLAGDEKFSVR